MVEIYSNDSLKIIQDKNNKTMYKIEFNYACPWLVRSLTKTHIIQGGTITDDYLTVRFKAVSVVPLEVFMEDHKKERGSKIVSINLVAKMLSSLSDQLSHIISCESKTIIGYSGADVIVIDGENFAFLDPELVADIGGEGNDLAIISSPFNIRDFFASPELLIIKELPSQVHYKTSYFSLGCLLLYALTSSDNFYTEYLKEKKCAKLDEYLNQLYFKNTKFYWLLSRCLVEEPEKRGILFI